jgi:D-3-phosphoglycerate dehydrogenase
MLHAQMDRGTVKGATLRYRGEVAGKNTRLITASFAAGWMEAAIEGQVNLVNAEALAKERGITITEETTTDHGDFGTMIQTEVVTERKTYIAAGTLFGKQFVRLVRLGPYRLDAHLDGNLLVFTHRDKPGLIGFIGTTFGRHGVNIAQMNVGRETPGGEAIGVVNLDSVPPDEALDEVRKHTEITSLSLIKLPEAGATPPWLGL